MSEFGAAPTYVPPQGGMVAYGADDRLWVRFFTQSVQNSWKSQETGRPVFEPKDFIELIQPGERDKLVREVRDEDKYRFPRKWEAYQAGLAQAPDGTPLSILYPSEPHIVDMMRLLVIHTIEQLAGLTEQGIQRLGMGGREHVARAKRYLEAAEKFSGVNAMQSALDAARDEIATLKAQVEQLLAAPAEKRGPGRPRKTQEEETY